ncbi:hypothetical protein CapIbe_018989 [Capra ibex]
MWGPSNSLGYQGACFTVREVELVKNLSATGVVLQFTADFPKNSEFFPHLLERALREAREQVSRQRLRRQRRRRRQR